MPFIHWEYADTFATMTEYAKRLRGGQQSLAPEDTYYMQKKLMQKYMSYGAVNTETTPTGERRQQRLMNQLHIRRSLDQYHYHALPDTDWRDKDQLVNRMFNRPNPPPGKEVVMVVDQLWLWVLQDSKTQVIRC